MKNIPNISKLLVNVTYHWYDFVDCILLATEHAQLNKHNLPKFCPYFLLLNYKDLFSPFSPPFRPASPNLGHIAPPPRPPATGRGQPAVRSGEVRERHEGALGPGALPTADGTPHIPAATEKRTLVFPHRLAWVSPHEIVAWAGSTSPPPPCVPPGAGGFPPISGPRSLAGRPGRALIGTAARRCRISSTGASRRTSRSWRGGDRKPPPLVR